MEFMGGWEEYLTGWGFMKRMNFWQSQVLYREDVYNSVDVMGRVHEGGAKRPRTIVDC